MKIPKEIIKINEKDLFLCLMDNNKNTNANKMKTKIAVFDCDRKTDIKENRIPKKFSFDDLSNKKIVRKKVNVSKLKIPCWPGPGDSPSDLTLESPKENLACVSVLYIFDIDESNVFSK